jgi:cytoskeletal protein RodZ
MVELKRKVTLKSKEVSPPEKSNKKRWLWLALALIVIAVVVVFALKKYSTANDTVATSDTPANDAIVPPTEQPVDIDQFTVTEEPAEETTPVEETVANETPEQEAVTTPVENATETTSAESKSVTQPATTPATQPSVQVGGDIEDLALKVIRGDYGNGITRKEQLGNKYAEVQRRVNQIFQDNGNTW